MYLRSGSKTENTPLAAPPEELSHVREAIRKWKAAPDIQQGCHPDEEQGVTWDEILRRQPSDNLGGADGSPAILAERIARANARRREQFIYWANHPDQSAPEKADTALCIKQTEATKSVKSAETSLFSKNTVARSDIVGVVMPTIDSSGARTVYAETVVDSAYISRVPDAPVNPDSTMFECPYCHIELNSASMQDRMTWKYVRGSS